MSEGPDTRSSRVRLVGQVATIGASVAFVVCLTLFDPPDWLWLVPDPLIETVGFRPVEMLLNVALFVPLGLSFGGWWPGRPHVLWFAVALSVGVELTQLGLADRVSDPVDVVTNSTGAALGFAVSRAVGRRRARSRR